VASGNHGERGWTVNKSDEQIDQNDPWEAYIYADSSGWWRIELRRGLRVEHVDGKFGFKFVARHYARRYLQAKNNSPEYFEIKHKITKVG
jgi:hypothetical protein